MPSNSDSLLDRPAQIRKILNFARERGYAKFAEINAQGVCFTTTGVLLGIKGTDRMFATLTDGRDQIQLIVTPSLLGVSREKLATLQRGSRISVTGVPFLSGRDEKGAIPSLYVTKLLSASS